MDSLSTDISKANALISLSNFSIKIKDNSDLPIKYEDNSWL